jgi:uncharacterized protein YndB with AHSA1/START domain
MDSLLDGLLPVYDFRTRYTRHIAADPGRVWDALTTFTYAELPVTRLLMGVRTAGRAKLDGPVALTSMPVLALDEGREAVLGQVAMYWRPRPPRGPAETRTAEGFTAFDEPGWAKGAMSLRLAPLPEGGTLLAAETRVRATDTAARRAFAPYWLFIRVGGAGFIRFEMLRAVARRAESARTVTGRG